ncbi:MAG: alpha/beta hydrolase [Actinomycetota bacterium]
MLSVPTSAYHPDLRRSVRAGRAVTWMARRTWGLRVMQRFMMQPMVGNEIEGVINDQIMIPSTTTPGHSIRTRIYKPSDSTGPLPVMLYAHGGGYQVGVPEQAHAFFEALLTRRDVAIVAPAYRLTLAGNPYPAGLDDCVDAIQYVKANAAELGFRDDRYMLAGHSAGGGMTAALTHRIVDSEAADIAFQMPVYPMLDHRMQTESSQLSGTAVWDTRSNADAWERYVGHLGGEVPEYASPALRSDVTALPPTISWVGDIEPFKDEVIAYIDKLDAAGIDTRFMVFEGGYHGFEHLATKADLSREATEFEADAFADFYDRYL